MRKGQHLWRRDGMKLAGVLGLVFAMGLTGCRHKSLRSALPIGVLAPVELEPTEPLDPGVEIAEVPLPELGPPIEPPAPPRPPVRRRPAPKEEGQGQTQLANGAEPSALAAIGMLSTGDDDPSLGQQQVRDLIASIVKRIAALPSSVANAQKSQIKQVKNFLDQADKALNSGDTTGANNLATKARLLMDDLEKR